MAKGEYSFGVGKVINMSAQEKHKPVKKYLKGEELVEYCKVNRVAASLDILEAYEKTGLLFPIYRLVLPDEYVRAVFEYDNRIPFDSNIPFDVVDEWQEIVKLANALSSYSFPHSPAFREALENGHPLDSTWKEKNPFLHKPSLAEFKPWEEYQIAAGTIDGHPIKEETVEHYYAPWQIFVVDELNSMHTIKENYATGCKQGWGIFKRDVCPSKLLEYSELFQTISNFRMMERLIWIDMTFDLKQSVIEGELLKKIITRTEEVAKKEYEKHPHAEWIKFIRKLVELYEEYLEKEKIKLSNELKPLLTSTINMVMDATKKSFEEISKEYDGGFTGIPMQCLHENIIIYPWALERIFPDELKQAKERSLNTIEFYIKQLNEILSDDAKIDQEVKEHLINSIIGSGHEMLLSNLYEIKKLWFNREPHWKSSLWAHIRSFAVSIESVGHEWYGQNKLGNILEYVFKKEYVDLRDSIAKGITSAETPAEFKKNLDKIRKHSKKCTNDLCGPHLVVAHLTRNYLSHNDKFEPGMFGSTFLDIYRDLVFTLISLFKRKP